MKRIAICYDFDGTLSPGNMQEYDFMKKINMTPAQFWKKSQQIVDENNADSVLSYMRLMLEEAAKQKVYFTKKDFKDCGKNILLYKGVNSWFSRINKYARQKGILVEHYIISSGLREMLLGNSIAKHFKHIYASSFMYNKKGHAVWPAVVLNYTTKTQFLFRINKGCLDINDPEVNAFIPDNKRCIPFTRMIYIGDGLTDVPCMSLVKKHGGFSIAVYNSQDAKAQKISEQLTDEGRADFSAKADYSASSRIENLLQTIIDKIATDIKIEDLQGTK